ncbi:hypothetical protein ACJVC5_09810 [Peredibacter sp. HCB2-198]|uniref:hypothetical protein n=1 Tax=Peredibacter sp. HCB2-198 TaxID=3383025 RepID=UPI0038B60FB9
MEPKDFLYGRKGPWPQPCPDHPYDESPGVIHLPLGEWVDWWSTIGLRFIIQWPLFTPIYFLQGLFNPGLKKVTDEEFHEYLTNSMMARFITPKMDEVDKKIFASHMKEGKDYYIVDLEPVRVVQLFKGIYASPTKTLLVKTDFEKFEIVCIYMEKTETILLPTDGDAWELAKYFVLQGGALCATMVVHPLQHFPMDSINAITKTALPKEHTLFKLLYAHMRFTLPLENAVLNFRMSLLHNDKWWKTYAPFPGPYHGIRELLVEGYRGIKNNDSYPPFTYPRRPPKIYSGYGVFLDAYFEDIYAFVSEVTKTITPGDTAVRNWANYIAQWIPGFPNGKEIFEGTTLTEVVAYYIWDVTVGHTIDHHNYGQMDVRKVALRIRQEPPKKGTKMKPLKKLQSPIDLMKYKLAMRLFFRPTVMTRLIEVDYGFKDHNLTRAQEVFKLNLRATDKKLKEQGLTYMDLNDIANTIQF